MRLARFDRRYWAPALAAGLVLAVGASAFSYTVDDAYVIARYAQRVALGQGWGLAPGEATDGVTGPLAIVPFVIAEWLGLDSVAFAKVVGLCCGAWAAALVVRAAMRHALGGPSGWLVALIAGSGATLGIWSAAGLETGMATLAVTTAGLSSISRPRPRGAGLGISIAVLAWLRPEAAVYAVALLSACVVRDKRQALVALGLGLLGALSIVGFRLMLFGSVLPLSWDAKPGELDRGLFYVLRALIVCTGLFSGMALAYAAARKSRTLRALSIALWMHLAAVMLAGGDWMPGFRLLAPMIPSYALLAGLGGARALALWRGERRRIAMLLLALAIGVPALDTLVQVPRAEDAGRTRETVGRELARSIAELAGDGPVALVDVGFLPWVGGFQTLDLGGVTEPAIGRLPGPHLAKPVSPELLSARGVSVIVLRSFVAPRIGPHDELASLSAEPVEERLARSAWVREHFRVAQVTAWSDAYFYVLMVRR